MRPGAANCETGSENPDVSENGSTVGLAISNTIEGLGGHVDRARIHFYRSGDVSFEPSTRITQMIIVTTPSMEGRRIKKYLGLVSGDAILGANIFRDLFAGIRDIVGGRSAAYEKELRNAKRIALVEMIDEATELGGNAIVGVDLDYETIEVGGGGGMLMVSATGTAVVIE